MSRSRLVRASKLPRVFKIPSTYWLPAVATADRLGNLVRVQCLGHTLFLRLSQRVRVLREAA